MWNSTRNSRRGRVSCKKHYLNRILSLIRGRSCSWLTSQLNPIILSVLSVHNYKPRENALKKPAVRNVKDSMMHLQTADSTLHVPPLEGKYLDKYQLLPCAISFPISSLTTCTYFFPFCHWSAFRNGVTHGWVMWEGELHYCCLKCCMQNCYWVSAGNCD